VNVKLPPARRAIGMAMFGLTATLGPLLDRRSAAGSPTISAGPISSTSTCCGLPTGRDDLVRHGSGTDAAQKAEGSDWFGIVCMAVGLGSLEVVLEEGERKDWFGSNMIVNLAIAAAIFIPLFITIELLRRKPFIDLRLLKAAPSPPPASSA